MADIIKVFGQIKKVYRDCGNGMAFFTFGTASDKVPKDADGYMHGYYVAGRLFPGAICSLEGRVFRDKFLVTDIIPSFSYRDDKVKILMSSLRGVGARRADRIYDVISVHAAESREQIESALKEAVPHLSDPMIAKIMNIFCIYSDGLKNLEHLLLPYGVASDVISRVYDDMGENASDIIQEHPYRALKDNVPLWVCESLAVNAGIDDYDEERVSGLLHYVMKRSVQNGYTVCPWSYIYNEVNYYSAKYAYHCLIVPKILVQNTACFDKSMCWDGLGVSYRNIFKIEKEIGEECRILASGDRYEPVYESDIRDTEEALGVKYGPSQRKAFSLIERPGLSILTGGPGTGKTTVVRGLIDRFEQNNPGCKIALCAPTGKAARRLAELTGRDACTIHKLIDYRPFGHDDDAIYKTKSNPVDADFVVVDEGSMVDIKLFYLLLQAMRPGTTVVVCGDTDQLPSVGPGSVLHDLIASGEFRYYFLKENYRQDKDGTILTNARDRILNGYVPVEGKDFHLIKASSDRDAFEKIMTLSQKFYSDDDPFAMQIIEPSYKGAAGVDAVNERMRMILNRDMTKRISYGDKVMFTRTDYKLGYVNGQLGTVSYEDGREIDIQTDGHELCLPRGALDDIVPAYSFTIHKAQGSEADRVIVFLPEAPECMLQKSLLYTAVTRARKEVYVVYVGNALNYAVTHNSMQCRQTRLAGLIRGCFSRAAAG